MRMVRQWFVVRLKLNIQRRYMTSKMEGNEPKTDKKKRVDSKGRTDIVSQEIAEQVASSIRQHQRYREGVFIEYYPGKGVLTEKLLQSRNSSEQYVCVENLKENITSLEELQKLQGESMFQILNRFPSAAVNLTKEDFQTLYPADLSKQDVSYTVFGILNRLKGFWMLLDLKKSLTNQESIFSSKFVELFLFCSPSFYRTILNARSDHRYGHYYTRLGVVYDLLFATNCILKLPGTAFKPWHRQIPKFREVEFSEDTVKADEVYLLHMIPKREYVSQFITEDLHQFIVFLKLILKSTQSRLIPSMDQWFPGCGLPLINMGFTMLDKVVHTNPEDLFRIFKEIHHWQGYEDSELKQILHEKTFHVQGLSSIEESEESISVSGREQSSDKQD